MIARPHRFHGYNSLKPVYRAGQTVRGPLMSLRYSTREARRPYRVAVVVSRKVHKSAVVRNRIRRRLYEIVRRSSDQLPGGRDLVFTIFSDQVATIDVGKLEKIVGDLLRKTKS